MCNDASFQRRWTIGSHETICLDSHFEQELFHAFGSSVAPHNPNRHRYSIKGTDIRRNIRGPSQPVCFLDNFDHRYRRFGRDAADFSPDEFVQHDVTENEDRFAGESPKDFFDAAMVHAVVLNKCKCQVYLRYSLVMKHFDIYI